MSKKMTPCEKLGYKVGDKFKVVDGTGVHYAVGSFITLIHDDGSSCPRFNGAHAIFESGDSFFPLDFVEKVAKLKPAKQALADAIHQNGGWPIEVHWLFSTSSRVGAISFWVCRPKLNVTDWFDGGARCVTIMLNRGLPNWHQSVLSREEYYQAYPKAGADGWIEWKCGMKSPVEAGVFVDVKTKDGSEHYEQLLGDDCWHDNWGDVNIIAYRLHKPDVKPEFCESVMRSIPEPEFDDAGSRLAKALELVKSAAPHMLRDKYKFDGNEVMGERKPTIEQLVQDYRNAKDYANRKQQEADDAKSDADEALRKMELAGEDIGLVVTPITAKQEPEPVIAVQVGDEVECVESNIKRDKYNGMVGRLRTIDESDTYTPYLVDFGGKGRIWCHEVKFIRRP